MLFVGDDWAEAHHDVQVCDQTGQVLVRRRVPDGVQGLAQLHALIADHLPDDAEPEHVVVGIETDRGPWIQALLAAGYTVYAIDPAQVARYRERHGTSGAKSDPGDAHVLAELVRLDRTHHRPVAGDSELAEAVKASARAHQSLIWARQKQVNTLRSLLREFYGAALHAFGTDLADRDALAVLSLAPAPDRGRQLTVEHIVSALSAAGRQRNLTHRAEQIHTAMRTDHLTARPLVAAAHGVTTEALVAVLIALNVQVARLQEQVERSFGQHPDADIVLSQPGLGPILGARVLAEFGDDPHRYIDAKARKNYAGTSPVTKASGTRRVVLARHARNRRLADALYLQAFSALQASPGARSYYDAHRARGATHQQALRALANRLVGILHGCLHHHRTYDEHIAWPGRPDQQAAAA